MVTTANDEFSLPFQNAGDYSDGFSNITFLEIHREFMANYSPHDKFIPNRWSTYVASERARIRSIKTVHTLFNGPKEAEALHHPHLINVTGILSKTFRNKKKTFITEIVR